MEFLWVLGGILMFIGFVTVAIFIASYCSKQVIINPAVKKSFAEKLEEYKKGPMRLVCEHKGCFSQDVKEYERKEDGRDWEGEPIALCNKHSHGYTHYSKTMH